MSFTYNGIHSDEYGLTVRPESVTIVPERIRTTQELVGFNGVVDYDIDRFAERILSFTLQFPYCGEGHFAQQTDSISKWLIADGRYKQLILDQFPDRYYLAKSMGETTAEISQGVVSILCTFYCNPPFPYSLQGSLLDPTWLSHNGGWDTNIWGSTVYQKELTAANNTIAFSVDETASVSPVIDLIGNTKSGITLGCSDDTIQINTPIIYDGVEIDCENETIVRMSDNANLFPSCTVSSFFTFSQGDYALELSGLGANDKVTVIVDFRRILP